MKRSWRLSKITEKMATDFERRDRLGESLNSIGLVYEVDPRTVKSWIQRVRNSHDKAHWETVAQNLDVRYLQQHHRLLVVVTSSLMSPLTADFLHHPIADPRERINGSVNAAIQLHDTVSKERGVDLAPVLNPVSRRLDSGETIPLRYGVKLLGALKEHEPGLERCVDGWSSGVLDFQKLRTKIETEAFGLWKQLLNPETRDGLSHLAISMVCEALEERLFSAGPKESEKEFYNNERQRGRLIRYDPKINRNAEKGREVYKGSKGDLETVDSAYESVLNQVKLRSQFDKAVESYYEVRRYVNDSTDIIDRVVLTGRPQGRCNLFPGCSMT